MVKTRKGLNTSGKASKGKKKEVGTSDDGSMVLEPSVMNNRVQKAKGRRSKSQFPATNMEDEKVLSPMPLRSIPPILIDDESTMEETPAIHNNYLPWVDYTKVREIEKPISSMDNVDDDDIGGEKSHDEIIVEEDVIEEEDASIVEERVIDSSCVVMSETAGMSEPSVMPSVNDSSNMAGEPSVISKSGRAAVEGNVSVVEDMVTENGEKPSIEGLGANVDPSVKDTMDGWKDSTSL
ncbi:hypothetical protein LIER_25654 [Lithospermum erythrorhizon]|uniref:Uncharacterized protein n=1 Tax=Lithospermum erythrorhizon TaxID=34254 RepID=A0AAV3R715_LITER